MIEDATVKVSALKWITEVARNQGKGSTGSMTLLVPHRWKLATLVCIALSGSSLPTKVAQLGAIGCDHAQVCRNTSNTPVVERFQWLVSFYYVHAIGLQANYIDLAKDWTAFFKYEHEYSAGAHHRALPCLGQLLRSAFQNPPPLPKRGNSFRFPANLYSNSA